MTKVIAGVFLGFAVGLIAGLLFKNDNCEAALASMEDYRSQQLGKLFEANRLTAASNLKTTRNILGLVNSHEKLGTPHDVRGEAYIKMLNRSISSAEKSLEGSDEGGDSEVDRAKDLVLDLEMTYL